MSLAVKLTIELGYKLVRRVNPIKELLNSGPSQPQQALTYRRMSLMYLKSLR